MSTNLTASLLGSSQQDSPNQRVGGSRTTGQLEHQVSTYSDLLKDPRWQRVRLEKLQSAEWACEICYDNETMLSVHHKRYVKGRKPWEYPTDELCVLCQPCHEQHHADQATRNEFFAKLHVDGPGNIDEVMWVALGYAADSLATHPELRERLFEVGRETNARAFLIGLAAQRLDTAIQWAAGEYAKLAILLHYDPEKASPEFLSELKQLLAKYGVYAGKGFGKRGVSSPDSAGGLDA